MKQLRRLSRRVATQRVHYRRLGARFERTAPAKCSTRLSRRTIIGPMDVIRIMTNLPVDDIETAKSFYTDYLGLSTEEFNMGWVARYSSPDGTSKVQLVTHDASAPQDSAISIHTTDVEAAYEEAQQRGYEIVVPLRTEEWGVHRFFVRAPDGTLINIVDHKN
jgi:catechol 2,3-dioxygenase-like lactoylglutathione lyase family enzyme